MVKQAPEIIFENNHFVAVNKPAGLLSIADREGKELSLKEWLQKKYDRIYTVHRLDKETSGLILFAKEEAAHRFLCGAFEDRTVNKYYLGIVGGTLAEKEKTIELEIMEHPYKKGTMITHHKGKSAHTRYRVMEEYGKFSFLEFQISTGRTHQIRVHMKAVGHPIVCDPIYGDPSPVLVSSFKRAYKLSGNDEEERPILQRLALHAHRLEFADPDGTRHNLEAPLPKDMRALLQQLQKHKK